MIKIYDSCCNDLFQISKQLFIFFILLKWQGNLSVVKSLHLITDKYLTRKDLINEVLAICSMCIHTRSEKQRNWI